MRCLHLCFLEFSFHVSNSNSSSCCKFVSYFILQQLVCRNYNVVVVFLLFCCVVLVVHHFCNVIGWDNQVIHLHHFFWCDGFMILLHHCFWCFHFMCQIQTLVVFYFGVLLLILMDIIVNKLVLLQCDISIWCNCNF